MNRLFTCFALACLLTPAAAHANRADGWVLGAQVGFGTPLGVVGIEAGWVLVDALTWTAGFGIGEGGTPQLATTLRLESSSPGFGFGLGGGFSVGGLDEEVSNWGILWGSGASWRREADWLLFANYELNMHYRTQRGATVRVALGRQIGVAGEVTCVPINGSDACNDARRGTVEADWPYLAFGADF